MDVRTTSWFKLLLGWAAVFAFRFFLLPFRAPNVEPMLATMMPFSKRFGATVSFLFGFLGIVLYDAVTSGWGSWTWVTAVCYGLLGVAAHFYFNSRPATRGHFVGFSIVGTLAYDAVTMMIGPVFNDQPIAAAVAGQIPFTVLHLLGAVVFAALLSPVLSRWLESSEVFSFSRAPVPRTR